MKKWVQFSATRGAPRSTKHIFSVSLLLFLSSLRVCPRSTPHATTSACVDNSVSNLVATVLTVFAKHKGGGAPASAIPAPQAKSEPDTLGRPSVEALRIDAEAVPVQVRSACFAVRVQCFPMMLCWTLAA